MERSKTSGPYPERVVLDGVPRAGYDVHLSPLPGSLHAILTYMGDERPYDFLMGVTGAAFRRLWNRDDGGNIDLSYFGDTPLRLAFDALGYDWRSVAPDREAMVAAIQESVARGVPAIGFGIIGPPEAGIVAGYGGGGAVLYGWSYFQPERDRYYEEAGWFESLAPAAGDRALIIIGDRRPSVPSERETLVRSLEWAIDLARTSPHPGISDHVSGLAAYDAWAAALEADADYPADEAEVMGVRTMVYGDQCVMVEERHEAARFLRRMGIAAPEAAGALEDAAVKYDLVGDLVQRLWPWPAHTHAAAAEPLADGGTRRELAGHVRQARVWEDEAVSRLEQVLTVLR